MTEFRKIKIIIFMISLFTVTTAQQILSQNIKETLFKDAKTALENAKKTNANVLAPTNFNKAMKLYKEAGSDYASGSNLEDIREGLKKATTYFNIASKATKLANLTFETCIKAREDALKAEADKNNIELWKKAEDTFIDAATSLEDGDVNDAKETAGDAEKLYRDAELKSIETNYFQSTRDLLKNADDKDVADNAPKTLALAKKLLKEAKTKLTKNRYDTDEPRNLAKQAKYEVKHAMFLDQYSRKVSDNDKTVEDIILDWETPLEKIASSLNLNAKFENGYEPITKTIVENILRYQDSLANLNAQNRDLKRQAEEMTKQLGSLSKEKSTIQQQLAVQAKIRQKFQAVQKTFSRDEAKVLRDGDNILIRLVGLNFPSGKSIIGPDNFSLLTKVQDAINTFPGSKLVIEGHTDSYGSEESNLQLSQDRADAVRQYLLANMRNITPTQISSVGYGESKPIANNETKEGRKKNRRIDIVIHPNLTNIK